MRIAICDDNVQEQKQVLEALQDYDPAGNPECFTSGEAFLIAAGKAPFFDLVFLDIYMPGENGVEIAERLKKISPSTSIVFVTISESHAVDAFAIRALHYLVKPVKASEVFEAVRRLKELQGKKRPVTVLPSGNDSYTVFKDEISYIQSAAHVKEVVLTNGRRLRVWLSFEELESKLGDTFLKLNRSTIVNMEQIEHMGVSACTLQDGTRLEFPRRERNVIREAYDNYLFARLNESKRITGEVLL